MGRAPAWGTRAIPLLMLLLLPACAAVPRDASMPVNDPNEGLNRHVMVMNQETLRPVSMAVRKVLPDPVHDRLHDLSSNLKEPRIFVNDLLQGRLAAAAHTGGRFIVNSTLGLGGLIDVARTQGWQQESGDFGQTLFVWGIAEGPYVVRPYLGPATTRDTVGSVVDSVADPLGRALAPLLVLSAGSQAAVGAAGTGLDAVDRLGQLKQAEDASIDFYSFVRSSYYQMRRAELREALGLPPAVESPATSDLYDDPADPAAPAAPTATAAAAPSGTAAAPPKVTAATGPKTTAPAGRKASATARRKATAATGPKAPAPAAPKVTAAAAPEGPL